MATRKVPRLVVVRRLGGLLMDFLQFLSQSLFKIFLSSRAKNARWTNCKLVFSNLAVLPQPPVLLQPGKAALHHPTLGHHLERMQFTALGDLYRDVSAQNVLDALGKRSAHIAAVTQQACTRLKAGLQRCSACKAPLRSVTSAVVTAIACGSPCVSTAIWRFDTRDFLARVIALLLPAVSVFFTPARPRSRTA